MNEHNERFEYLKNRSENDAFFLICCLIEEVKDVNRHLGIIYDKIEVKE